MKIRLVKIEVRNLGPFVGSHTLELPESGVVLLKGEIEETGEGSGCGKSILLNAIPFVIGGCPWPATALQSWHTEEKPDVKLHFTQNGTIFTIERNKGLKIVRNGEEKLGKAAESLLDTIFGVDRETRQLLTYRKQKSEGFFLSMGDTDKKAFLTKLLDLGQLEQKSAEAYDKIKPLQEAIVLLEQQKAQAEREYVEALESVSSLALAEPDLSALDGLAESYANREADLQTLEVNYKNVLSKIYGAIKEEKASVAVEEIDKTGLDLLKANVAKEKATFAQSRKEYNDVVSAISKDMFRAENDMKAATSAESERTRLNRELATLRENTCFTCGKKWIESELAQAKLEKDIHELEKCIEAGDKAVGLCKLLQSRKNALAEPSSEALFTAEQALTDETCILNDREKLAIAEAFNKRAEVEKGYQDKILKCTQKYNDKKSSLLSEAYAIGQQKLVIENQKYNYERDKRQLQALEQNVSKKASAVEIVKGQILSKTQDLNKQKDIVALVGREGFLGVIFGNVLEETANIANDLFSQIANIRHVSVQFHTEIENKKGNINKAIVPVFNVSGNEVRFDGPGLSGGMVSSVELPIDISLGEVIMNRKGVAPGWLILDEPFNGLGDVSKEAALEMLTAMAVDRLIIVVDHSNHFQNIFKQTITIKQKAGLSTIC